PLHAFARYVWSVTGLTPGNFIDLVDEDDAHLLGALGGNARNVIHIDELAFFFLDQIIERLRHRHFSLFLLLPEKAGEHVLNVDIHLLDALIGDDFKRGHGTLVKWTEGAAPEDDPESIAAQAMLVHALW